MLACGGGKAWNWKSKGMIWCLPSGVLLTTFPYLFPPVRCKDPVETFSDVRTRQRVIPYDVNTACINDESLIFIMQMNQACMLYTTTRQTRLPLIPRGCACVCFPRRALGPWFLFHPERQQQRGAADSRDRFSCCGKWHTWAVPLLGTC